MGVYIYIYIYTYTQRDPIPQGIGDFNDTVLVKAVNSIREGG